MRKQRRFFPPSEILEFDLSFKVLCQGFLELQNLIFHYLCYSNKNFFLLQIK